MKLSIIIVNYNVKYFLEQCLCSVMCAIEGLQAEVIVVDNASTDRSVEYLQPKFPSVKFIISQQNLGFGKANNIALKQCTGDYVLFLNPDTIIPEDCLQKSLAFIELKKDTGAIGIRMLDGGGHFLPESKRSLPTPVSSFFKLTGLAAVFPHSSLFNKYALGNLDEKENHEVDVLCGAFFLSKRNLLLELNGFDEDFFMYAEDIDLSYRIQKAGYKNYYFAESAIIHFKGESSSKSDTRYVRMFYEAMILFVKKHYSNKNKFALSMALQTAIVLRGLLSAMSAPFRKKITGTQSPSDITLMGDENAVERAKEKLLHLFPHTQMEIASPDKAAFNDTKQELIFCMGLLTYKTTLLLVQQLSLPNVKWFGKNTGSMVGSTHKNSQGEVYIVPTYVNTHHEQ